MTEAAHAPPAPEYANGRDARVMDAVRHFRVVVRAIQAHSSWVERQCGLSAAQLWALSEVATQPGMSVSDVSRRLSIKPATASNLLDKIERKGLLRREREGRDQRVVQLYATEAGLRLLGTAPQPPQGALVHALARLQDDRLGALADHLAELVDQLELSDGSSTHTPLNAIDP